MIQVKKAKINEIQDERLLDEIAILLEGDDWWEKFSDAKKQIKEHIASWKYLNQSSIAKSKRHLR